MKKLLIVVFVLVTMGFACLPLISSKMAEDAFAAPLLASSSATVKNAIGLKMYIYAYHDARMIAEKAAIFMPESDEAAYFHYTAALCAEKESVNDAAVYWYNKFIQNFPDHPWITEAKTNLEKLKASYGNKK